MEFGHDSREMEKVYSQAIIKAADADKRKKDAADLGTETAGRVAQDVADLLIENGKFAYEGARGAHSATAALKDSAAVTGERLVADLSTLVKKSAQQRARDMKVVDREARAALVEAQRALGAKLGTLQGVRLGPAPEVIFESPMQKTSIFEAQLDKLHVTPVKPDMTVAEQALTHGAEVARDEFTSTEENTVQMLSSKSEAHMDSYNSKAHQTVAKLRKKGDAIIDKISGLKDRLPEYLAKIEEVQRADTDAAAGEAGQLRSVAQRAAAAARRGEQRTEQALTGIRTLGNGLDSYLGEAADGATAGLGSAVDAVTQGAAKKLKDGEAKDLKELMSEEAGLQSSDAAAEAAGAKLAGQGAAQEKALVTAEGGAVHMLDDTASMLPGVADDAGAAVDHVNVDGATGASTGKRVGGLYDMLAGGAERERMEMDSARSQHASAMDRDAKTLEASVNAALAGTKMEVGAVGAGLKNAQNSLNALEAQKKVRELHLNKQWAALAQALGTEEATLDQKVASLPHIMDVQAHKVKNSAYKDFGALLAGALDLIGHMHTEMQKQKQRVREDTTDLKHAEDEIDRVMGGEQIKALSALAAQDHRVQHMNDTLSDFQGWGYRWHKNTMAFRDEVVAGFKSLGREFRSEAHDLEESFKALGLNSVQLQRLEGKKAADLIAQEQAKENQEEASLNGTLNKELESEHLVEQASQRSEAEVEGSLEASESKLNAKQQQKTHEIDGHGLDVDKYLNKAHAVAAHVAGAEQSRRDEEEASRRNVAQTLRSLQKQTVSLIEEAPRSLREQPLEHALVVAHHNELRDRVAALERAAFP